MIWHSPDKPLRPIRIPIRYERGREKIRIPGRSTPAIMPMASSEALRVIKSSEIRPSSRRKTTKVRTTVEIKNGGATAFSSRTSIFAIDPPED
jgi:hypothetical protein